MIKLARPNAVLVSEFRSEIDDMILEGKSDSYIERWLADNDAKISRQTIGKYRRNDFNVNKEATIAYNDKKSKEKKDKEIKKRVSDIEALDDIIDMGNSLDLDLGSLSPDIEEGTSALDIEKAKIQAKNLVIRASKVKHDITKDEPPVIIEVKVGEMDDEEQALTKEVADALARQ